MTSRSQEKPPVVGPKSDPDTKDLPECGHPTADGGTCRSTILTVATDRTKCWMHSVPRDELLAATMRGGRVTARALSRPDAPNPALKTLDSIQHFLEELGGEVLRGVLSSRDANALTRIAEAAVRAHDSNVGQRLDELEALVAKRARSVPAPTRVRVIR